MTEDEEDAIADEAYTHAILTRMRLNEDQIHCRVNQAKRLSHRLGCTPGQALKRLSLEDQRRAFPSSSRALVEHAREALAGDGADDSGTKPPTPGQRCGLCGELKPGVRVVPPAPIDKKPGQKKQVAH